MHRFYVKDKLYLSDFNETSIFLTDFLKNFNIIFMKIRSVEASCSMWTDRQAGRQAGRHDEANNHFSQSEKAPEMHVGLHVKCSSL